MISICKHSLSSTIFICRFYYNTFLNKRQYFKRGL
ncbi:helix-turn-helix domain-containing protein [Patescibacteria group bacterium]|nr:helix-turn-helix domain-containing protein [Patescibacteria group bacterium]